MMKQEEMIRGLNELKAEAQRMQRKGLPFMMASVVIWSLVCLLQWLELGLEKANMFVFMCTCLLLPLAFLFSKLLGADIFQKTDNPINKLAFLCTMNQMLYLLIVMWACSKAPEAMVMLFAMVFGAHLLPYGWAYDSRAYTLVSVLETVGALLIGCILGSRFMTVFMIIMQIVLCCLLYAELRRMKRRVEG